MHVVLEELHEPSLPQHGERVLDEVHAIQSAVLLYAQRQRDDVEAHADVLSALGNFRFPMVFAGEYSVQGGEAHTIVNHPIG